LEDSAARKLGPGTTLQHVLRLAQQLNNTDTPFDMKTYEHLLSAYSKAGKCDKIKLLLKQMKAKDIKPARIFFDKALQVRKKALTGLKSNLFFFFTNFLTDSLLQGLVIQHYKPNYYFTWNIMDTQKRQRHITICLLVCVRIWN
jgi:pentatricopeptide repeat protein